MDQLQTLLDVMYSRRSIRRYIPDRPVERDKIRVLLDAAMSAPSACNLQTWEFVVVDEPEGLRRLKDCIDERNGRHYNAPAAFVVCSNTSHIPWDGECILDCGAAIQNLLLAAEALGLGAVWIGAFDPEAVRGLLGIPAHVAVVSLVLFGYPAEQKPPRTQYAEDAVFWQTYDPERTHPQRTPIPWPGLKP